MKPPIKHAPEGAHTLTPHLIIKGAAKAIDFYKQAFGAAELIRMPMPNGSIMYASLQIGDSQIYLNDEFPEMNCLGPQNGGSPVVIHMFVPDVDKTFNAAVAAGASVRLPVSDMFWGDRYGQVIDPFGHHWSIATHKEDLSPAEMGQRAQEAMLHGCGADKA